jgi:hypothetical protein
MSESHRPIGTWPSAEPWPAREDKLVRMLAPAKVATLTGRTIAAVYQRRRMLKKRDEQKGQDGD